MQYSIIIPTLNQCDKLLKPCLESILAYTTVNTPDHAEIIIVANGCTDNTREYVTELQQKFHNIHLIWRKEPLGYTKAVNLGMAYSTGQYLVLLNNDTILLNQSYNQWLEKLILPFKDSRKAGITGPMKVPNDGTGLPFLIFFCVMISREVYEKLGPLDEIFSPGYGEDTDYCLKAEIAGYDVIQVPYSTDKYYADKRMTGDFPIYHAGNQTFGLPEYQDEALIHKNNQILIDRYGALPKIEPLGQPILDEFLDKVDISKAQKCDGYMADSELTWLAEQAKNHRLIIEVGSWHGKSSRALVDNLAEEGVLLCVDHWKGSETERDNNHQSAYGEDGDAAYLEFLENMWDTVGVNMHPIRLSSKNAAKYIRNHGMKADMIFIDAGHTKEEVKADIENWLPCLNEGGLICGHDAFHINNPWPGVLEAAREAFDYQVKQAPNTSIWVVENPTFIARSVEPSIKRFPCVYDCFPFHNELDILEKRFKELHNAVDRFVIVEAMMTHGGKPKELVFPQNLERFAPYLHKVTYLHIEKFPEVQGNIYDKAWARERYQREFVMNGITDCQDDDVIIISDCDEIPYVSAISEFLADKKDSSTLEMDLYYYNDHTRDKNKWLEAKITRYKKLKEIGPCGTRYNNIGIPIIHNAGNHYSYFGGVEAIIKKIEDAPHQEYNKPEYKNPAVIAERVAKGEDIFGRPDIKFEKI